MNRSFVLLASLLATTAAAQVSCVPSWSPNAFVPNGPNGTVFALVVFDDGTGPALYAGGQFLVAGGANASNVAKWNGTAWADVGGGTNNTVYALAVFGDGTGAKLYAGGAFTTAGGVAANRIARWNGSAWAPVGSGTTGNVNALAVFGTGASAALYVGGSFGFAGGLAAANIARWNFGGAWSNAGALPSGPGLPPNFGGVKAFAVFDDGTGPVLYAGGNFGTQLGMNHMWKWNGTAWTMVGAGAITAPVSALAVHDDGTGAALYSAGGFANIAMWNGSAWSALAPSLNGPVTAVASFDDGSGAALYASGFISMAGATPTAGIARWSGGAWSAVGAGINGQAYAFATWNDGSGNALFVAGAFSRGGGLPATNIAKLSGAGWAGLAADTGVSGTVNALILYEDGTGPTLFAGGMFTTAAGANNLAKLGPAGWIPIAANVSGTILALAAYDDGGGPALYAGGLFSNIDGVAVANIAKWNGTAWSPLGSGAPGGGVFSLAAFDDGTGPALYVGGVFTNAGGVTGANYMVRWNGTTWAPVGFGATNGFPYALTVLDDGRGRALFAGGGFTTIGGTFANNIARWDGTSWSALGAGTTGVIYSLGEYPSPSGPSRLVAGGEITAPGSRIVLWNGTSWSALGAGVDDRVTAIGAFDDGAGTVLYAGGLFATAGGLPAARIARWNGTAWSSVGDATGPSFSSQWVRSFAEFDDGTGRALYAGGQFVSMGGVASLGMARRAPAGPPVVLTTLLPQIIYPGGPVTLSVTATGTQPISYQWRKNMVNVSGATGPSLAIAAAAPGDAGSYDVVVSNACGNGASNAATLTLIPGLGTYGTSTPGCAGFPFIGATSMPQVGNSAFALWIANVPPNQQGLCAVSGARLLSPLWVSGLAAWIDPASTFLVFIPVASDPAGFCFIPAGLPPDPSLAGFIGYAQGAWSDPCAPGGLTASNALGLIILP